MDLVSGLRPRVPGAAVTGDDPVYRQLALWWNVIPVRAKLGESSDELLANGEERLKSRGLVESGDTILILSGHSNVAAATNMLRVHEVS